MDNQESENEWHRQQDRLKTGSALPQWDDGDTALRLALMRKLTLGCGGDYRPTDRVPKGSTWAATPCGFYSVNNNNHLDPVRALKLCIIECDKHLRAIEKEQS